MRKANIFSPVTLAALSLLIVLPACSQKEDIIEEETYTVAITAVKGSADETRALELSGNYLQATWKEGDVVSVYLANPSAQSTEDAYLNVGTLTAQSSGSSTTLAGTLTGTFSPGDNLFFSYQHGLMFDYRGQKGTLEEIASKYDFAITGGTVDEVSSSTFTLSSPLYFSSMQSIFKFTLKDTTDTALEASKLVIQSKAVVEGSEQDFLIQSFDPSVMGVFGDSGQPGPVEVNPETPTNVFFVALSAVGEYGPMSPLRNKPFAITATVGGDTYTYSTDDFTFYMNNYYVYDVIMIKQE